MQKKIKILIYFILFSFGQTTFAQEAKIIVKSTGNKRIECSDLENGCAVLEAVHEPSNKTTIYDFSEIPYQPIGDESTLGEQLSLSEINAYSDSIQLGFNFNYYNQNFSSVLINENGFLSFDFRNIGLVDIGKPLRAIMGVHQDLVVVGDNEAKIYYKTVGEAPHREFVVTFYNALTYFCPESQSRTTTQIRLKELSNEIEVHILKKAKNCGEGYDSALGISNDSYKNSLFVTGKVNNNWEASQVSYKFRPIGKNIVSYEWFEGDEMKPFSRNKEVRVCPKRDNQIKYRVKVYYDREPKEIEEDSIMVGIPFLSDLSLQVCDNSNLNLNDLARKMLLISDITEPFQFLFYDGNKKILSPDHYSFSEILKTVDVVVETKEGSCIDNAQLILDTNKPEVLLDEEITICDNIFIGNGLGVEKDYSLFKITEKLKSLYVDVINPNIHINYYDKYYKTKLPSKKTLRDGDVLYVGYESDGNCIIQLGKVKIKLNPPPTVISSPELLDVKLCDIDFNKKESLVDESGKNISLVDEFIDAGLKISDKNALVSIFLNYEDALANRNRIDQVKGNEINSIHDYYIRVEQVCSLDNCESCFSIYEKPTKVKISFYGVQLHTLRTRVICTTNKSINFDLSCLKEEVFYKIYRKDGTTSNSLNELNISYYNSKSDAEKKINPITSKQDNLQLGFHEFYIRYEMCDNCAQGKNTCYSIKPISLLITNNKPDNANIHLCVGTGGSVNVNTGLFTSQLFDSPKFYNVEYYKTKQDAEKGSNKLLDVEIINSTNLYAKINVKSSFLMSVESCVDNDCLETIQNIKINVSDNSDFVNELKITEQVCNNDLTGEVTIDLTGYDAFVLQKVGKIENYEVIYYKGSKRIDEPTEFIYTIPTGEKSSSLKVNANVFSPELNCNVVVPILINFSYLPVLYVDNWTACVCLPSLPIHPYIFSGEEVQEIKENMFSESLNQYDLNDVRVSFFSDIYGNGYTNAFQNINAIEDFEINTPEFDLNSEIQINKMYVRFESKETGCFSIGELELRNLLLPNVRPNEHYVCDDDFDGNYEVNLSDLDDKVLDFGEYNSTFISEGNFQFSYFYSLEDAKALNNPIIPLEAQEASDFYWEIDYSLLEDDRVWVRVDSDKEGVCENSNFDKEACKSIESIKLIRNDNRISNNINENLEINYCEDNTGLYPIDDEYNDGMISGINLTQIASEIKNRIPNIDTIFYYSTEQDLLEDDFALGKTTIKEPYNYTNQASNGEILDRFFVKYTSTNEQECSNYIEVRINVEGAPVLYPEKQYYMCPGSYINIHLRNPNNVNLDNYSFLWTGPDGQNYDNSSLNKINKFGHYTVQITSKKTGCSTPVFNFEVVPTDPPLIESITVVNNTATILASGLEGVNLEYSLGGDIWQASNVFQDLQPGVKTFYVRYGNYNSSCISDAKQTIILDIKNVITPNGDGRNDYWEINHLDVLGGNSTVQIFDRNGVEVYKQSGVSLRWNGKTNNGQKLPTTDYWYILKLFDGRVYKGHITLKNK